MPQLVSPEAMASEVPPEMPAMPEVAEAPAAESKVKDYAGKAEVQAGGPIVAAVGWIVGIRIRYRIRRGVGVRVPIPRRLWRCILDWWCGILRLHILRAGGGRASVECAVVLFAVPILRRLLCPHVSVRRLAAPDVSRSRTAYQCQSHRQKGDNDRP